MRPPRMVGVRGSRFLLVLAVSLLALAAPAGAAEIDGAVPKPGAFAGKKTALVFFHPF
jgi:hypothetical protein